MEFPKRWLWAVLGCSGLFRAVVQCFRMGKHGAQTLVCHISAGSQPLKSTFSTNAAPSPKPKPKTFPQWNVFSWTFWDSQTIALGRPGLFGIILNCCEMFWNVLICFVPLWNRKMIVPFLHNLSINSFLFLDEGARTSFANPPLKGGC